MRLRPSAACLSAACLLAACATIPPTPGEEADCITIIAASDGSQVYKNGERVLGDDLVEATEESRQATWLASRARAHEWYSIGSFVVGGVLLAPGIGLIAGGAADKSTSDGVAGAVLAAGGLGGIIAGVLLRTKSIHESGQAVTTYNEERHHCR